MSGSASVAEARTGSPDALAEQLTGRLWPAPAPGIAELRLDSHTALGASAERAAAGLHLSDRWVLIGPWRPGGAPSGVCGSCLQVRWLRIRAGSERDVLASDQPASRAGRWPIITDFLLDAITGCLAGIAESRLPDLGTGHGYLSVIELDTLAVRTVQIVAEPLCPSCATWSNDTAGRALLAPRSRPKPDGSGYRLGRLVDYPLPAAALVNDVCGVIGAVAQPVLTSPTTSPVTGRLGTRSHPRSGELTWSGQRTDYRSSTLVGYLEGLERYAGSVRRQPIRPAVARLAELGSAALDPRRCGVYDDAFYRDDPQSRPFDPQRPTEWVWGYSLRDAAPLLIAQQNAFYAGTSSSDSFVHECSSGCATGSCLEEAMLFGLLELIERDAFLLGWYGNVELPRIALDAELGQAAGLLVDRAGWLGYDVELFDNRVDLPVPVVTALARRRGGGDGNLVFASAAALDPVEAVLGALGEILTYLPGRPEQIAHRRAELQAMAGDFSRVSQLRDHAELFGLAEMAEHAASYLGVGVAEPIGRRYADWPGQDAADLREDLMAVVGWLAGAGFDVIALDQTTPEQLRSGVRGVRMIVPGLIPIDFGWSRQRALGMPRLREAFDCPRWRDVPARPLRLVPHPFP